MYIMISYLLFILQFSTWLQYEPMEKASNEEWLSECESE